MTHLFFLRYSFFAMFAVLEIVVAAAQPIVPGLQFNPAAEDSDGLYTTLVEWNDMLKDIKNDLRKRRKNADFKSGREEYRTEVMEIKKRIGNDLQKAEATTKDKVGFIFVKR